MATFTVANLEKEIVRQQRARTAERLEAFRQRTSGRGAPSGTALLEEARNGRIEALTKSLMRRKNVLF